MKIFLLIAVVLFAAPLHAQIFPVVCHGCPDRASYASAAERTTVSSQCHWSAPGANLTGDLPDRLGFNPQGTVLDPAHVHIDLTSYQYGEMTGPWRIDFKITLRNFAGQFGVYGASVDHAPDPTDQATDWFWDDTQSAAAPMMVGGDRAKIVTMIDAFGRMEIVQTYTGHFTAHPRSQLFAGRTFHGFDDYTMAGNAVFTNGDQMGVLAQTSYWDNLDPSAPITLMPEGLAIEPVMETTCSPIAAKAPADTFGANEMAVRNYLPTAPLSGVWTLPPTPVEATAIDPTTVANGHGMAFTKGPIAFTNSYGGQALLGTPGSCQLRHDVNFHMGIPGTIQSEVDAKGIIYCALPIDNTGLAVGPHNWIGFRFQPENSIATNGVASLLVVNTTVPPGTIVVAPPPPPVCVPPAVAIGNTCVNPLPPPTPVPLPPPPPPTPVIVTTPLPVTGLLTTINGVAQPIQLCVGDATIASNCKPF